MKLNRKFLFVCIIITILLLSWSIAQKEGPRGRDRNVPNDMPGGAEAGSTGMPEFREGTPGGMSKRGSASEGAQEQREEGGFLSGIFRGMGFWQREEETPPTLSQQRQQNTVLGEIFGIKKPGESGGEIRAESAGEEPEKEVVKEPAEETTGPSEKIEVKEEPKEEITEAIKEKIDNVPEEAIEQAVKSEGYAGEGAEEPEKAEEIKIEEAAGKEIVKILEKVTVEDIKKGIKEAKEEIKEIDETIEEAKKTTEEHKKAREEIEAILVNTPEEKKIEVQEKVEEAKTLELETKGKSEKAEEKKLEVSIKKSREELKQKIKVKEELEEKIESETLSPEEKSELEEQIKNVEEEEKEIKEEIDETKEALKVKQEEVKETKKEVIKQEVKRKVIAHVNEIVSGETKAPTIKLREEMTEKTKEAPIVIIEVSEEKAEESIENIHEKILEKERTEAIIGKIKPKEITSEELNKEIEKAKEEIDKKIEKTDEEIEILQRKVKETAKEVETEKTARFYEEIEEKTKEKISNTVVTITITPKKTLNDFTVYEEIPKGIAEDISRITIYTEGYTVIESDPLIMWHFAQVSAPIEISYGVNKKIEIETIKQAVTVPVADQIVGQVVSEESIEWISLGEEEKKPSIFSILLPLLIIPLIGIILVYFNRFVGEEYVSYSLEKTVASVQEQLHKGFKKEVIKNELVKKGWPDSVVKSAFLIAEKNEKNKIEHHVGRLVYQIRMLSKRGHQIEDIRNILVYKKRYPPLLVSEALKKFKSVNRK